MEQKNRQEDGLRFEVMESRQQVNLGGDGAKQEIDRVRIFISLNPLRFAS